jgi:hypothetical protein
MSDCLHCEIHNLLESHLQNEQADLSEIAARVTEVLADLILMAAAEERTLLMAQVLGNLGGMVLGMSQREADPSGEPDPSPQRSRHRAMGLSTASSGVEVARVRGRSKPSRGCLAMAASTQQADLFRAVLGVGHRRATPRPVIARPVPLPPIVIGYTQLRGIKNATARLRRGAR